ncbi:MAG: NAD-dependent epimerase/dehydratase family protein [Pseudomonadota bacterium]
MKVLVTGGAGFIGSHIVDAYLQKGLEVIIFDNLSNGKKENINPKAKFFEIDVCHPECAEIIKKEKPQIINHHAAQVDLRQSVTDPINDIKNNLTGLIHIIEKGLKNGLQKVIFASSGGAIYGEADQIPTPENYYNAPLSPYGINKLTCENYLYYYHHKYGLPYVSLRYANVFGPRQKNTGEGGVVAVFLGKILRNQQPVINGDGKQTRDFVYVADIVEANLLALKPEALGAYNIGTGIETNINELFILLKKITKSNFEEKHGPSVAGEQLRSSLSSLKIEKQLGWKSGTPLKLGLQLTTEWYAKHGN